MSNIQKPNHNKHIDRQKAYDGLMSCISELVCAKNILVNKHNAMVESWKKANKQRKEKMEKPMHESIQMIYATNRKIKRLLKEKQVLESRGCK